MTNRLYCNVSMLLTWSLFSLYYQLREAQGMMTLWGSVSGTYPIHSGMSRVFYLPQHAISTEHEHKASSCFTLRAIDWLLSLCLWKSILKVLWAPLPGSNPDPPGTFCAAGRVQPLDHQVAVIIKQFEMLWLCKVYHFIILKCRVLRLGKKPKP